MTQTQLTQRTVQALHQSALSIAAELSLDSVLQQIVNVTRDLVAAEYAALGVPNNSGMLERFIYSGISEEIVSAIPHLPQGFGLLGQIIDEAHAIRVENIADSPHAFGFPPGHPQMTSFLGVPIKAGDKVLGRLYMTNKIGARSFSEEDEQTVEMLAAHAAVAIQNARLYEQVEQLAVMEERKRIGMDLHDGVIQSIYGVGLALESARMSLPADAEEAALLMQTAVDSLNGTIQDIRNFIMDLRPRRFHGNLAQGLEQLVREFQANTLVVATLTVAPQLRGRHSRLSATTARTFFLTVQEALANVARHASADNVQVSLTLSPGCAVLTVIDDGCGFDMKHKNKRIGHGLANMQSRAQQLNGRFQLHSAIGQGTRLTLTLPLKAAVSQS